MIFKVLDYSETPVILSENTWFGKLLDPIFGHPEVKPFLPQIRKTLKQPEYVFRSFRDPRCKLFYSKISHGMFASYFLAVVVKYVQEQNKTVGYVSTVMINRKLPSISKLLWERKISA